MPRSPRAGELADYTRSLAEALGAVDRTAVQEMCEALVRRQAKPLLARIEDLPHPAAVIEPDHETVLRRQEVFGYTGGAGIALSGSAELPFIAVTLVSRRGYFRQVLDSSGVQKRFSSPITAIRTAPCPTSCARLQIRLWLSR